MLTINNNNSYNSPNFRGFTVGPKATKALDKVGAMKSPSQRLIFGAAALALHPVIDKFNPWVDEDTRNTSAVRSAAKAIACTLTGVVIREACILGTNALLNNENLASKLPKYMTKDKNHAAGVIGTLMGLGIMVFTNFIIDVPLTNKLTNTFSKWSENKGKQNQNEQKPQNEESKAAPEIKTPSPTLSNYAGNFVQNTPQNTSKTGPVPVLSQANTEVINGHNK